MICLSDNDIIKKLAICDLLDETLAVLGIGHQQVFVLPSTRFVLGIAKHQATARSRLGPATFDRLERFLGQVQEIAAQPPTAEQLLFDDALGIDPGEAIFFLRRRRSLTFSLPPATSEASRRLLNYPQIR